MKKLLLLSMLPFLTACNGQKNKKISATNPTEDMKRNFIIGNYMIVPELKEVRVYTMVGGKDWDGFTYRKDPEIDYDNTVLLVLGDRVFFKEHFPFRFDVDKLKIIQRDKTYFLCRDDDNIYYTSERLQSVKVDISGYNAVNDFIYKSKKDGALFFLDIELCKLIAVGIDVDEKSIKHLSGNYYYDKKGLYFLGGHSKKNAKGYYDDYVEKSEKLIDAKDAVPVISEKYFSFDGQVFAKSSGNNIKKLNIDVDKIIETNMAFSEESFISDGSTVYSDTNYGYDDDARNEKGYYGIWYPALYSSANLQKIYSPLLHFRKEGNSIVFNKNNPNDFPGLIVVADSQNYLLADKKKLKIDKMVFYHPETKTTEVFDEKYLKIYAAERFIQYKNVLYFDGIPVETSKLDIEHLQEIKNSNYLTDGKSLFYIGNIGGYSSTEKNGTEYAVFDDRILESAYTKEMNAVNPDLLSDAITLVSRTQKVKIKDLNLNVKIVK